MMIDNASNLWPQICLVFIEDIMIDQGYLINSFSRWILLTELIVEVELVLVNFAVFKMDSYLKITEEVGAVAINDRDPLLV